MSALPDAGVLHELDASRDVCPMTFVRTRLALDRMKPGEILLVRLRGDEPVGSVSRRAAGLGHELLGTEAAPDGTTLLRIRKN
jgi:tRNA 2-thiouridine synthesizing protein A